ncbi:hypothetical protein C7972_1093 [Arenibacter sp. ARW7G5Y1]|nr:hypothetical protein C7972_1093 [Arenibacter sp. ARW7G5Y1]
MVFFFIKDHKFFATNGSKARSSLLQQRHILNSLFAVKNCLKMGLSEAFAVKI